MWQAINDVNNKKSNAILSAGNTGALFVISKLNMKMIDNITKPALAALLASKCSEHGQRKKQTHKPDFDEDDAEEEANEDEEDAPWPQRAHATISGRARWSFCSRAMGPITSLR